MSSADRAAARIAIIVGIVLIVPSATAIVLFWSDFQKDQSLDHPLVDLTGTGDENRFDVIWNETAGPMADVLAENGAAAASVDVELEDRLLANVTVEFGPCSDDSNAAVREPATFTWRLLRVPADGAEVELAASEAPFTCGAVPGTMTFDATPHPDVASIPAATIEDADETLWAEIAKAPPANVTVTYRLELTAAAGSSTVPPLPVPVDPLAPNYSLRANLMVSYWDAAVQSEPAEVPK